MLHVNHGSGSLFFSSILPLPFPREIWASFNLVNAYLIGSLIVLVIELSNEQIPNGVISGLEILGISRNLKRTYESKCCSNEQYYPTYFSTCLS